MNEKNNLNETDGLSNNMNQESMDNSNQTERPMTKKERADKNNTDNLRNAADVAIASKEPHAAAVGGVVKAADALTGGKSTEMLGKTLTKALKRAPGGKRIQKKLNKLNESGMGDKIGKAASLTSGMSSGGGTPSGGQGTSKIPGGTSTPAQGTPSKPTNNINPGLDQHTKNDLNGGSLKESLKPGLNKGKNKDLDNEKKDEDATKEGTKVFDSLKSVWSKVPMSIKLFIFLGLGIFLVIVIIASFFIGIFQNFVLDYSDDVEESEVKEEYKEYWAEICGEGAECTEEEKAQQEELLKSQQEFYDKLDSLGKKYDLTKEEKYLVLTTIFFNYDVREFSEANGSFELDETDEIDYSVDDNVYTREQDSLKELIKQFQITAPYCQFEYTGENGEMVPDEHGIYDSNNNIYRFGYFDRFLMGFGIIDFPDGYVEAVNECKSLENGTVVMRETTNSKESIEAYYSYLRNSTWLDDRPAIKEVFEKYAARNNLSPDMSTWPEEEKIAAREEIIEDIKMVVGIHMEEKDANGLSYSASNGRAYWWPIGSLETSEDNGVLFASGDPQFTGINSPFGTRVHPITGTVHTHSGIDLQGRMNETNIIASLGGTVTSIVNECASSNSFGCGSSYGNHVVIQDIKGNINIYAHMYRDSITVSVGDQVMQGQVLGKVGSSGNSTGAHLHFTIKVNGVPVEPLDYIDPENPRPMPSEVDFHNTSYTKEEFIAKVKSYYSRVSCSKSGCQSFKSQILNNDGAETIYEVASSKNLNPEIFVARSILEGYSPGTYYNYFGYSCYNGQGVAACRKFTSFEAGVTEFYNNISQYDSLEAMLSRYAYIGKYWYTGKHWDLGGCAYAPYIYPDGIPGRVQEACAHPDGYCSANNTSRCTETTAEDQEAYARWQVSRMADTINSVFN